MPRSLFDQDKLDPVQGAWHFEQILQDQGLWPVAGVDEVGRGCLAGPVVAAAVILPKDLTEHGITHSKRLSATQREPLAELIKEVAVSVSVARIEPKEIDRINILQASLLAMKLAVKSLSVQPRAILVDGNQQVPIDIPQKTIIKGDSRSCSIAAASIVAKVYRDRLMEEYSQEFPQYLFEKHKGYGTKSHREMIRRFGPCPIHRKSFRGVCGDG